MRHLTGLVAALVFCITPAEAAACILDDFAPSEELRTTAELGAIAACAIEHGDLEQALELYRAAYDAAPPSATHARIALLFNIGRVLELLHRDEESVAVYATARELSAGDELRRLIDERAAAVTARVPLVRAVSREHDAGTIALGFAGGLALVGIVLGSFALAEEPWLPRPTADVLTLAAATLASMGALLAVIGILRLSTDAPTRTAHGLALTF